MGLLDKIIDYTTTITGGKYVDEGFDNYGTADDGGSMMSSDAMRHLLWTAEMSRKINPETAKNDRDTRCIGDHRRDGLPNRNLQNDCRCRSRLLLGSEAKSTDVVRWYRRVFLTLLRQRF